MSARKGDLCQEVTTGDEIEYGVPGNDDDNVRAAIVVVPGGLLYQGSMGPQAVLIWSGLELRRSLTPLEPVFSRRDGTLSPQFAPLIPQTSVSIVENPVSEAVLGSQSVKDCWSISFYFKPSGCDRCHRGQVSLVQSFEVGKHGQQIDPN